MYVILTSRAGRFRTELVDGMTEVEAYDYAFYGKTIAHFVIAELSRPVKVRVVEETPPGIVNHVPSKFLDQFDTIEAARAELHHIARFGSMDIALTRVQPMD
jgi:hypothetical protein